MNQHINRRLFIYLSIGFIIVTIIGTLSHEMAHYLVAKYEGYNPRIHYASTSLTDRSIEPMEEFWFTLAGPLETITSGTIGLILLLIFRRSYRSAVQLSFGQWAIIFISLFWLRQTANLFLWIGGSLITGWFSHHGDEIKIAEYLHLPVWTLISLTAITGAGVLIIIIFKFIPVSQRSTFILSGLTGGLLGYILWMDLLGKIIMP